MPHRTMLTTLFVAAAALAAGFVPGASAQVLVPFYSSGGFEPPTYTLGNANGQAGWTAVGSIVNNDVQSGTQAARTFGGPATGFSRTVNVPLSGQKMVLEVDVKRVTNGRTVFWIGNTFLGAAAYIGIASGNAGYMIGNPNSGDLAAQHPELPASEWRHLRLDYDFFTLQATGYVDGQLIGTVPIITLSQFPPSQLNIAIGEINQDVYFDNVQLSNAADYSVTTAGGVMTATDFSGQNDSLTISQPAANTLKFVGPRRRFIVNNGPILFGESGNVSLTGIDSVTVNAGAGNDTITVSGPINPLPNFTINGDTGDDLVTLTGALPLAAGSNLDLDLLNDDASPGVDAITLSPGAQVSASGSGAITIRCSRNVTVGAGANLETVDGDLVVEANRPPAAPTLGNFIGVYVDSAMVRSTGTGQVSIAGRGGSTGERQYGVRLRRGASFLGGTSGTLLVDGIGGISTELLNGGVRVDTATVSSLGADVVVTGQGGGDPLVAPATAANIGVVTSAAQVTAGGSGSVTVQGTGGTSPGSSDSGVQLQLNTVITSSGGDVTVIGHGGGSPAAAGTFHGGVVIIVGSQVTAGGSGTVTVEGTAGTGPGDLHRGIEISNGGLITSSGGPVLVTGTGGSGAGQGQLGMLLSTGTITSGGGPVTVAGHAGAGTGNGNNGVHLQTGSMISSGGGNVSVTGTYGSGISGGFVCVNDASNGVSTVANGGDIEIVTDAMAWGSAGRIAAPADGRIRIRTLTAARGIYFINTTYWLPNDAIALTVTDVMLNGMNAGTIEIDAYSEDLYVGGPLAYQPAAAPAFAGSAPSEAIALATASDFPKHVAGPLRRTQAAKAARDTPSTPVQVTTQVLDADPGMGILQPTLQTAVPASPAAIQVVTSNFELRSGLNIGFLGSGPSNDCFDTGGGTLLVSPGASGAVLPMALGTEVTATNLSMDPGSTLLVTIDSTTAGTGYQQLTVAGPVDLSNVSLEFTGTYVPVEGDTFTIVRNGASPTTGTFVGLPEGATIPNFMGSALGASITYQGGTDDDVQLVVTSGTTATPGPEERVLPTVSGLSAPRPSPFISSTNLSFALAVRGHAALEIFSVDGRRVRTLASGAFEPGEYQMRWDGRGDNGGRAGAGVYYVRLTTPQGDFHRTLVLLK